VTFAVITWQCQHQLAKQAAPRHFLCEACIVRQALFFFLYNLVCPFCAVMALTLIHLGVITALLSSSIFGQSPTNSKWPSQSYKSMPDDFLCPVVTWNKTAPTVPGYLFFAPIGDDADRGGFDAPTIMTDEGDLVWRPTAQNINGTRNFDLQSLNGNDVLTYWTGDHQASYGCGYGSVQILDTSFNQMYNVCMVRTWAFTR
jgi:hypothetical protein